MQKHFYFLQYFWKNIFLGICIHAEKALVLAVAGGRDLVLQGEDDPVLEKGKDPDHQNIVLVEVDAINLNLHFLKIWYVILKHHLKCFSINVPTPFLILEIW